MVKSVNMVLKSQRDELQKELFSFVAEFRGNVRDKGGLSSKQKVLKVRKCKDQIWSVVNKIWS